MGLLIPQYSKPGPHAGRSFADAEVGEEAVEEVVGIDAAEDLAEGVGGVAEALGGGDEAGFAAIEGGLGVLEGGEGLGEAGVLAFGGEGGGVAFALLCGEGLAEEGEDGLAGAFGVGEGGDGGFPFPRKHEGTQGSGHFTVRPCGPLYRARPLRS